MCIEDFILGILEIFLFYFFLPLRIYSDRTLDGRGYRRTRTGHSTGEAAKSLAE